MGFIDSYKKLEKLCGEIYGTNHGLSSYIDEMINNPMGAYYVHGWNDDLKQLKHYRWVRNQIVHEPGCTEENMCGPNDVQWLNTFYSRIMSASDPLALYRKERTTQLVQPQKHEYSQQKNIPLKQTGCLTYIAGILLMIVLVVIIINFI